MEKRNKKRTIIYLGILIVTIILAVFVFKENDSTSFVRGFIKLNFSQNKIVKLDIDGSNYLTKNKNTEEVLIDFLDDDDYELVGQMGSGYFFENNKGEKIIATHRYYFNFYSIWNLKMVNNAKDEIKITTIQGTFSCLPLIDNSVPHNDLCIFALLNDEGNYFRLLDRKLKLSGVSFGEGIEVEGIISLEKDVNYQSIGQIEVIDVNILSSIKNLSYIIPEEFSFKYVSFQDWKVSIFDNYSDNFFVVDGEIACEETSPESSFPVRAIKKDINGQLYCIKASSEGAAGSVYTKYAYSTVEDDKIVVVSFIARYPRCTNYSEIQRNECQRERESMDLDQIIFDVIN
jgi:hypothetical protein